MPFDFHYSSHVQCIEYYSSFICYHDLKDPQRLFDRCVHSYLRNTVLRKDRKMIRIIDKVLKKLY